MELEIFKKNECHGSRHVKEEADYGGKICESG